MQLLQTAVFTPPQDFHKDIRPRCKVLIDNEPETKQVLKDSTAFLLTDAMSESMKANRKFARSGVSINSTSTRAALTGMSAAGKSGTTTSNNDVWFVGFTPYYTAGVWGGCDNNQKLKHGGVDNGGTSFHKDIWRNIMNRVHEGLEDPDLRFLTVWRLLRSAANPENVLYPAYVTMIQEEMLSTLNILQKERLLLKSATNMWQ